MTLARSTKFYRNSIAIPILLGAIGCGTTDKLPPASIGQVQQAVGEPVRTVTLPPEINCPADDGSGFSHVDISVAAVPAADIGHPELGNKVLLATSCRNAAGSTIYFVDPGNSDQSVTNVTGTVVDTLTTSFTPRFGWGAIAFRGDVEPNDLIACANPSDDTQPHGIYSIDLATGTASKLFDAAMPTPGKPFCDGLAWDSGSDTFYMSPDVSKTVYHYAWDTSRGTTPLLLDTLPVPDACLNAQSNDPDLGSPGNSGIVSVGPDLLLACDGAAQIFEVSKKDGSLVRSFNSGAGRSEDMECDSTTFGPDLSVAWTKDAFSPQFLSFSVPPGTCGLCRSVERPDLNSLSPADRALLASLELEYLTGGNLQSVQRGAVVAEHRVAINTWHTSGVPPAPGFAPGGQFFPGHRGYIGELEFWLKNVKNHPEFVPLPKWDPNTPIPQEFLDVPASIPGQPPTLGVDQLACQDSTQLPPAMPAGNCGGILSPQIDFKLPDPYVYSAGNPTGGLCSFSDIVALQTQDVTWTPAPNEMRGNFEGTFHGGVHIAVNGTMADVMVSPSALIFFPWHAFVDDVAYKYECACKGSCAVCADVFTPFTPGAADPSSASFARRSPSPPTPSENLGFWWWFEDEVVPPVVTVRAITDHSGFFHQGEVRGRAKLVPGRVGQALELDGKDDFVIVHDRSVGEVGGSSFTLDGWIKTSATGLQPIVTKLATEGGGDHEDEDADDDDHDHHADDDDHDHHADDDDHDHHADDDRGHHDGHGKAGAGYALFLQDGRLGLILDTADRHDSFVSEPSDAGPASIADGAWHHVAAVVDREYAARSKLFVDGQVVLQFDATRSKAPVTSRARLELGRLGSHAVARFGRKARHQHAVLFKGQMDEIDLFRSALPPDRVASIFVAGSAGKFGALGNLPTTAGQAPCIDVLAQRIAALPPAKTAPLNALYNQMLSDLAQGHRGQARRLARQIADQAEVDFDGTYATVEFHAVAHQVDACLNVPPLSGRREIP